MDTNLSLSGASVSTGLVPWLRGLVFFIGPLGASAQLSSLLVTDWDL